jgi:nucleoside-diphosphate-sugar epimerase
MRAHLGEFGQLSRRKLVHRAIVSGTTGHLGREIAAQLAAAGFETHGLTRQERKLVRPWTETVRIHQIDGSTERLAAIINDVRPDTIFHVAGQARREHQRGDVAPFVEANILFGTQLLEAMRWSDCRRFVTAGSYLQHFDSDGCRALNLYAATKQAFEAILEYYVDSFGFSAVRLTLSDIYSEHDTRPKLMTDIATAWTTSTPVNLQTNEAWVDLIHVADAASAFMRAASLLETNVISSGALHRYSVSSGYHVSATELVGLFEKLGDRKLIVKRAEGHTSSRTMKPWRGTVLPGWTPKVNLEEGIRRIIAGRR